MYNFFKNDFNVGLMKISPQKYIHYLKLSFAYVYMQWDNIKLLIFIYQSVVFKGGPL